MQDMSISTKIANFASDTFEKTGNEGSKLCIVKFFGEPEYSIDLLLDEEK